MTAHPPLKQRLGVWLWLLLFEHWLAPAPVVALGALLDVFMVALIGRKLSLLAVAVLCVGNSCGPAMPNGRHWERPG